jgi:anthranilate synthase component 2
MDAERMLLMIDNYDSFTFNLVQYLGELGQQVKVIRNDALDIAGIRALNPAHIMISPGPGTPDDSGVSLDGSLDEIMGLRHKTLPVEGVQFHPESILTQHGHDLLRNFLGLPLRLAA